MSAEYSVEDVRHVVRSYESAHGVTLASQMLAAYANRIEADDGAVPDGWSDAYAAFKGAFDTPAAWLKDNSEYANDARKRLREFNEAMLAAAPSAPEGGEVGL